MSRGNFTCDPLVISFVGASCPGILSELHGAGCEYANQYYPGATPDSSNNISWGSYLSIAYNIGSTAGLVFLAVKVWSQKKRNEHSIESTNVETTKPDGTKEVKRTVTASIKAQQEDKGTEISLGAGKTPLVKPTSPEASFTAISPIGTPVSRADYIDLRLDPSIPVEGYLQKISIEMMHEAITGATNSGTEAERIEYLDKLMYITSDPAQAAVEEVEKRAKELEVKERAHKHSIFIPKVLLTKMKQAAEDLKSAKNPHEQYYASQKLNSLLAQLEHNSGSKTAIKLFHRTLPGMLDGDSGDNDQDDSAGTGISSRPELRRIAAGQIVRPLNPHAAELDSDDDYDNGDSRAASVSQPVYHRLSIVQGLRTAAGVAASVLTSVAGHEEGGPRTPLQVGLQATVAGLSALAHPAGKEEAEDTGVESSHKYVALHPEHIGVDVSGAAPDHE